MEHNKENNEGCSRNYNDHTNNNQTVITSVTSKELMAHTYVNETKSSSIFESTNKIPSTCCALQSKNSHSTPNEKSDHCLILPSGLNASLQISSNTNLSATVSIYKHPQSLYLLALAKLHECSSKLILSRLQNGTHNNSRHINNLMKTNPSCTVLRTPESLASAPPSYSFVLRQTARRRPTLMGTFIPSPSFVQHSPPPNYAAAFDIYVEHPIPPPRVYHFGYLPMLIICPECGYIGTTIIKRKIILSTHLCALTLCLLCCWICAPLPYVLRSCKEVHHYCRNCRILIGMYYPTNPENSNAYRQNI